MEFEGRSARIAYAAFTACAAFIAAVAAHWCVDIVADFALPHDTYDDGAHASRALMIGVAVMLAFLFVALRLMNQLRGKSLKVPSAAVSRSRTSVGTAAWILIVAAGATVLLGAMGWFDASIDHLRVDDFGDLFGGSLALGIGSSTVLGVAVAATFLGIAGWFTARQSAIAATLAAFVFRDRSISPQAQRYATRRREHRVTSRRNSPLAYRIGKRGPPGALQSA